MSEPVQVTAIIQTTAPVVAVAVTIGPAPGGGTGTTGPIGPEGPAGPVATLARRHAYAAGKSYCGRAPAGTAESAAAWTITRITVATDGSVTTAIATDVAWSDYSTAFS